MLESYFAFCLGVLGLAVGSFLNVVIARVPREESIVRPPSHCPRCGYQLRWYENVPVFSWLLLRGKCSSCKAPISPRYLAVELLTCVLFLACLRQFGWTMQLTQALVFVTLLVPLVFIDAEHWILPFELTVPGIALGVLLQLPLGWPRVKAALIGAVAGYLAFRVLEFFGWLFFRKETLGAGDKFLLAMVGAFLGWKVLFGVIAFSALQGAVVGLVMLKLTGRAGPSVRPGEEKKEESAAAGGPAPETPGDGGEDEDEEPPPATFTPDFLRPGLSFGRRLLLIPWTLLLQPIPDEPEPEEGEEEPTWEPGATNLPFGPWIGLAALEVLLLRPYLAAELGPTPWRTTIEILFGL